MITIKAGGVEKVLNNWSEQMSQRLDQIIRMIAFECFSTIIQETPVDTGLTRSSWQLCFDEEEYERGSGGSESEATQEALDKLKTLEDFSVSKEGKNSAIFMNNIEYAPFIRFAGGSQTLIGVVIRNVAVANNRLAAAITQLR